MKLDFNEGRIDCPGLSKAYLRNEIDRKIKKTLGYIVRNYDGEEFIETCYETIFEKIMTDTEKEKYSSMVEKGLGKEGLCYKMMLDANDFTRVSIRTQKLYKCRYKETEWDVSGLLEFDGQQFVSECYREILERRPDEGGYVNYCKCLYEGMPKEVVIYMLAASDEAMKLRKTKDIKHYRAIYDNYMESSLKTVEVKRIEKLKWPIRSYPIAKEIKQMLFSIQLKDDYRNEQVSACLQHIMEQNDVLLMRIAYLEKEIERLERKENEQ